MGFLGAKDCAGKIAPRLQLHLSISRLKIETLNLNFTFDLNLVAGNLALENQQWTVRKEVQTFVCSFLHEAPDRSD